MRIFNIPPEIGDLDGFTPDVDIFGRATLGEGLTHLAMTAEDPLVIALDADWGAGKTIFLKMWAGELRKLGFPVIYFDAYANDYVEDAFVALAGEVIRLAQTQKIASRAKIQKFTKKALGVSKILVRSAGKIAAKAVTLGALDGSEAEGIAKAISNDAGKEASNLADKYLEHLLTGANDRRTALEDFRKSLADLPALLLAQERSPADGNDNGRPLIFIIDELDRCKPPFALEILERIKHVMSVPNVHFVLGIHVSQLLNSVRAQYGNDIDARIYLQKFIHVTVPLVDTAEYEHESVAKKFIQHLSGGLVSKNRSREIELTNEFMLRYTRRTDLSLRGLERVYSTLTLALAVANDRTLFIAPLVAGLAALKLDHPALYRKAKRGSLTYDDIGAVFGFDSPPIDTAEQSSIKWSAGLWRFATDPNASDEILAEFGRGLGQYHVARERLVPFFANSIIDRFKPR